MVARSRGVGGSQARRSFKRVVRANFDHEWMSRERRRQWQRLKLRIDPDYQDNQTRAQQAWTRRNPDYWQSAIVSQIRTVLTSPESVASVVRHIQRNGVQIDEAATVMAMGRLNDVWEQLFPAERHRIANLMIERIDLVHAGEVQGIKVKWRELGWNALIGEFAPVGIGAEMLEVEA